MILEDATHEAYGYYPSELKPKSAKRILATCDECGKVRRIQKHHYHSLCKSCAGKGKTTPDEVKDKISGATKGKTLSEDHKRKISENHADVSGDKSHFWKGGISFEPYCIKFNKAYKDYIRNLFGNKCFICGKTETANGRKLDVHHPHYNKKCGCDGTVCHCVPLCVHCHGKTNGNRDHWESLIMLKLKNTLAGW